MAEQFDGSLKFGTEISSAGFVKGTEEMRKATEDTVEGIERMGEDAVKGVQKLSGFASMFSRILQTAREAAAKATGNIGELAGASKLGQDAVTAQNAVHGLNQELDALRRQAAKGTDTEAASRKFQQSYEHMAESISNVRDKLEALREKNMTDKYKTTVKEFQQQQEALQQLVHQQRQMENDGVDQKSEKYMNLVAQIEKAEQALRGLDMKRSFMEMSDEAFIDPKIQEFYDNLENQVYDVQQGMEAAVNVARSGAQQLAQDGRLVEHSFSGVEKQNIMRLQDAIKEAETEEERIRLTKELQAATERYYAAVTDERTLGMASKIAGAWRGLKNVVTSSAGVMLTALKKVAAVAGKITLNKIKSGLTNLLPGFKSLKSHITGADSGAGRLLRSLTSLKGMLFSRMKRSFISYLMSTISESIKELARYDKRFDEAVSNVRNRIKELGANLVATFGGLVRQIAPIIASIIQALSTGVAYLNSILSTIRGEETVITATKQTESYAASLDSTATSAKKAAEAQKKLNSQLTSYDELHKLDGKDEDDSGAGSGSSSLYQTQPVAQVKAGMGAEAKQAVEEFVDAIKHGRWEDAGAMAAIGANHIITSLTTAVQKAKSKAYKLGSGIAQAFNGAVSMFDGEGLGRLIGEGINTAVNLANGFLDIAGFETLGKTISDGLNGAVETIDWTNIGQMVSGGINKIIDAAHGFVVNTKWKTLGESFGEATGKAVREIKWEKLGETISTGISGILNSIAGWIEKHDWKATGNAVVKLVKGFKFGDIAGAFFEGLGAALGGFAEFVWGLIEEAWKSVETWWKESMEAAGGNVIGGLFIGIAKAIAGIGLWIYEHIFKPFIDGFCKAFGIASPSKVMADQGGYIITGLLNGIVDGLVGIFRWVKRKIFQPIWDGLVEAFEIVGGVAKKVWDIGKWIIEGIKNGITDGIKKIGSWLDENIATPIISGVKGLFGISSPSRVFREIGEYNVEGLKDGMTGSAWQAAERSILGQFGELPDEIADIESSSAGERFASNLAAGMERGKASILDTAAALADDVSGQFRTDTALALGGAMEGTVSGLDAVAAKLGAIAAQFREIGLYIPQVAAGSIIPAKARIPDSGYRSQDDGEIKSLLTRLLDMLDGNQGGAQTTRITIPVMLNQREIAQAVADYNVRSGRITNGGMR